MSDEPVRVVIVDDHPMFREGLTAILSSDPGIEMVGAAADGMSAVSMAIDLLPDVVLMDLNLPDLNGIDATRQILEATPTSPSL